MRVNWTFWSRRQVVLAGSLVLALIAFPVLGPGQGKKDGQQGGQDIPLTAEFREASPLADDEFGADANTQYVHGSGARILILGGGRSKGNLTFRTGGREKGGGLSRNFALQFDPSECVIGPCNPPFTGEELIGIDDLWADFHTSGVDLLALRDAAEPPDGSGQPEVRSINAHLSFQWETVETGITGWLLHWADTVNCPGMSTKARVVYDPGNDTWVISAEDAAGPMACLHGWGSGPHQGSFASSFRLTLKQRKP